ncbi:MAG TPA: hypothetical protein DIT89_13070 [Planctomycetaceae bacterium]|nr:hypothetical protein [Planctomycetaceae bacterium]
MNIEKNEVSFKERMAEAPGFAQTGVWVSEESGKGEACGVVGKLSLLARRKDSLFLRPEL